MPDRTHPKPELLAAVRDEAADLIDDAAHALINGGDPKTAWWLRGVADGVLSRPIGAYDLPATYRDEYLRGYQAAERRSD